MEKALIVKGPVKDLSDLLRIARKEAKVALNTNRVVIKPVVYPYGEGDYLVIAMVDGCRKSSDVGDGRMRMT